MTLFIEFIFSVSIVIFSKWEIALNAMNMNWTNIVFAIKLSELKYWFVIQFNLFRFVCFFSSLAIPSMFISAAASASSVFAKIVELCVKMFAIFFESFSLNCWFSISFLWKIVLIEIVSSNCFMFLMMYSIVLSFQICCSLKMTFRTKMIFCLCDIQTQ